MEGNVLLTRSQVADFFQVSIKTIRRWEKAGKLPSVPISRNVVRYRTKDVRDLVDVLLSQKRA